MNVLKKLNPLCEDGKIRLGIHNHLISQNTYLDMWERNTQTMADFVDELKKEGVKIDFVDFGGGYPIEYSNPVPELSIIGNIIYKAQERMTTTFPDMKYIFEPGRKLIGESVAIIGKITHIKNFLDKKIAILSCSLYNCSMDTLIVNLFLTVIKLDCNGDNEALNKENYIIRGSTPDSLDVFSRGVDLPQLKNGDYLAFLHAGAYSFGSEFISLSKPKNIII
jgi:diaminopimelate decarboxylase